MSVSNNGWGGRCEQLGSLGKGNDERGHGGPEDVRTVQNGDTQRDGLDEVPLRGFRSVERGRGFGLSWVPEE